MTKEDELTISKVRHEMAELEHLLATLGAALKFIAQRPKRNRIIYVIDYTELKPYWEASRPRRVQDLHDESAHRRVEDYLTGLERICLRLSSPQEQIKYLDLAYYEQAELIDGLTLNGSFETIILPNQWLRLRDSISYFFHWGVSSIDKFVTPINENTQLMKRIIKESKKQNISSIYQTYSQNIGFESAKFKKHARISDLLFDYVSRANFRVPQDFSWAEMKLRAPEAEKLSRGEPDLEVIERWEVHIAQGNQEYSDAYSLHGHWVHAPEGAETLAWMEMADQSLQDATASHLRIALVTRNRQYHHASRAAAGHSPNKSNQLVPWVFHPRLLNAFMVDQMAFGDKANAEFKNDPADALAAISQLRSSIRLVDEFLGNIDNARRIAIKSNSSLGRYVRNQLSRSWERYRRQGLAEQIQIRISHRKGREDGWNVSSSGRKDKIAAFLDQILATRLTRTQIDRERALIGAIPTEEIWPKSGKAFHGKYLPIDHTEVEFLVLFKSDEFARAFIFRSDSLKNIVADHLSELKAGSGWDGYLDIQAIFSSVISVFHAEAGNVAEEAESREDDRHNLRILRFDVLMLCAVCLAARSQCALAQIFIAATRAVWSDAKPGDDITVEKQLLEIAYLESILSRTAWRKAAYDRKGSETPSEIFDTGIINLNEVLSCANKDPQHKRLALSAVGFARELYSYGALHSLDAGKIRLSVKDCLECLALTYDLSCDRRFWFTAARSKQQFLAFLRMAKAGRLPLKKSVSKQFSEKAAQKAYVDMIQALNRLRESDPHWNDRDLPITTRITEAIGKWVFRLELKIGRAEIRKARELIVELRTNIREPGFQKYVNQRVQEIDKFLKGQ